MTVEHPVSAPDLREWFDAHGDELRAFAPVEGESLDDRVARGGAMLGFLDRAGVMGRGWSPACGGSGGTAIDRALVYDLLVRSGLDLPEALGSLGGPRVRTHCLRSRLRGRARAEGAGGARAVVPRLLRSPTPVVTLRACGPELRGRPTVG